ncbi:MAG: hypothetical protein JSS95_06985 [Acidobacteria bacterium]|nr:hypothetical protein [Acidobacteriota bacterium]
MADNFNTAESSSASDRQPAVEQLFIRNYDFIQELAQSDPRINSDEVEQITSGIAKHLSDYTGHLTDTAFRAWTTEIILPIVGFYAIKHVARPFVLDAIWKGLGHSAEPSKYDDYPETVRELEQEVWLWVFLNVEKLQKRGTAKITTRLYRRAAIMTKNWMKRQKTRRFAVIRRVYDLPKKSQFLAERKAAELDRESEQAKREEDERKEIIEEMKKLELMA